MTADVAQYLHARGIGRAEAVTHRLGVVADPAPGHERMRGFLAIPYLAHDGHPLTIRFRCLQQHDHREHFHGKYMSVPDDPARIYNVGAVHAFGDQLHIAEGELDAIVLNKVGLPAVAVPGAQNWAPYYRRMFAGFSRIYVWGDPDEAGADLVNKATRALRAARAVPIKGGDVTDIYTTQGAEALHELAKKVRR